MIIIIIKKKNSIASPPSASSEASQFVGTELWLKVPELRTPEEEEKRHKKVGCQIHFNLIKVKHKTLF